MDNQKIEEGKASSGKKLLVPIFAIALFMVLVGAATYAYFSASVETGNVANAQAIIPDTSVAFDTQSNTCSFTVDAALMTNALVNTTEKASTICSLNTSLTAAAGVKCTYDMFLVDTTTTDQYSATITSPALSGDKEFTGLLTEGTGFTASSLTSETNLDTYSGSAKNTKIGSGSLVGTGSGKNTSTTTLELKWYNINKNQDGHKGHTYTYELRVGNIVC